MKPSVYKKGQIVWAKVRGYPWWPAIVNETNQKKNGSVEKNVTLTFLAEDKIGTVPTIRIVDYDSEFDKLCTIKNKKLQEAIKIASDKYGAPKKAKSGQNPEKQGDSVELVVPLDPPASLSTKGEEAEKLETAETAEEEKQEDEDVKIENESETTAADPKDKETDLKFPSTKKKIEEEEDPRPLRPKKAAPKAKKPEPNLSKVEKKQQMKAEEKAANYQDAIDLLQRRSTRSQAKTENIEMFTAPLIYSSRKHKKHEKGSDKDTDNGSIIGAPEDEGRSGSVDENRTPQKEKLSPGKSSEEKKVKKKSYTEPKKGAKTRLGKREAVRDGEESEVHRENLDEQMEIETGKKPDEKKKETKKKVKSQNAGKISNLLKGGENSELKGDMNVEAINNNENNEHTNGSLNQKREYNNNSASSSHNHLNNNESHTDKMHESESTLNPKQATSGNLEAFNQPAPKASKNIDLKNAKASNHTQAIDAYHRKSVCQKLAKILEEAYALDKDSAQELTLYIEGRINSYFASDQAYYTKVMKILYKLMKGKMLQLDELKAIINLEYTEFKAWLQKKIETAITSKDDIVSRPLNNQSVQKNQCSSSPKNSKEDGLLENMFLAEEKNQSANTSNRE